MRKVREKGRTNLFVRTFSCTLHMALRHHPRERLEGVPSDGIAVPGDSTAPAAGIAVPGDSAIPAALRPDSRIE